MKRLYRYKFGATVFDEARPQLTVRGVAAHLAPRQRKLLSLLLSLAGRVVSRDDLIDAVWGLNSDSTGPHVLDAAIDRLRRALGDDGGLLKTVHKTGYRFDVVPAREDVGGELEAHWVVAEGKPVPRRPDFVFEELLGRSRAIEVWRARSGATGETRVYKLCTERRRLRGLKHEARLAAHAERTLGPRSDIVRLLAAGFEERPYFLEFEDGGEDLLAWSLGDGRLRELNLEARLALFVQVAEAVAALHTVPICHADIKPRNILIAPAAGGWQLRLADLGSGQALQADLLNALQASAASQAVGADAIEDEATRGTFLYMAPELWLRQPASALSDVYSLGILLFQLVVGDLTRRPPHDAWAQEVPDELLRTDILGAIDSAPGKRPTVAKLVDSVRQLDARRIERQQREAEQAQAQHDREALRRLRARRPWVRATMASLAAGLIVSLALYGQMRASRRAESEQRAAATTLNKFLTEDLIAMANPAVAGRSDVTVADAARKAAARIDTEFGDTAPEVRAGLHAAMQEAFSGLTDYPAALDEGTKALQLLRKRSGSTEDRQQVKVELMRALSLVELGRQSEAVAQLDEVERELASQGWGGTDLAVSLWDSRAYVAALRPDLRLALHDSRKAWALLQALAAPPADLQERVAIRLANTERMLGQYVDAERDFRTLLGLQMALYGAAHQRTCYTNAVLAEALAYEERRPEALALLNDAVPCLREKLGAGHARALTATDILAGVYFMDQQYLKAADLWSQEADWLSTTVGERARQTQSTRLNIAIARQYGGRSDQAQQLLTTQLSTMRGALPESDPVVQHLRYHLADCRLDVGTGDGVSSLLVGLSAEALNRVEIESDWEARIDYQRGRLALLSGDRRAAGDLLEQAAAGFAASHADGHLSEAVVRALMARSGLIPSSVARN